MCSFYSVFCVLVIEIWCKFVKDVCKESVMKKDFKFVIFVVYVGGVYDEVLGGVVMLIQLFMIYCCDEVYVLFNLDNVYICFYNELVCVVEVIIVEFEGVVELFLFLVGMVVIVVVFCWLLIGVCVVV